MRKPGWVPGVVVVLGTLCFSIAPALLAADPAKGPTEIAPGPVDLSTVPAVSGTTAMLADGQTLNKINLKPGPMDGQVTLERAGEADVNTNLKDLQVVDFGKLPTRPLPPSVRLTNGDQVYGQVSFPTPRQVKVTAGWGSITIPIAWCSLIRPHEKGPVPGPVTKDTLFLETDRVEGDIQSLTGDKVTVKLSGATPSVDMGRVTAIALAPRSHSAEPKSGVLVSLDLGGGERVTGLWEKLTPDELWVRTDWGDTVKIPIGSLARLEVKNGRLVYLSTLKPTEVRQVPFLESALDVPQPAYEPDRSVSGRPLRLRGKTYARGLGTHSRCDMTYTLDGGYQTLQATLGIDDAVGDQGSVVYRVFGDDKLLFESPIVRGGEEPVVLKVPVKGVLILHLQVDYADNGDIADHADWADARLLR